MYRVSLYYFTYLLIQCVYLLCTEFTARLDLLVGDGVGGVYVV
jgi:hypothetical protein